MAVFGRERDRFRPLLVWLSVASLEPSVTTDQALAKKVWFQREKHLHFKQNGMEKDNHKGETCIDSLPLSFPRGAAQVICMMNDKIHVLTL